MWLYALLLPSLETTAAQAAPLKAWLAWPLTDLDPVGQGFVVGILVNTLLLVGVSLMVRAVGADAEQARAFVLGAAPERLSALLLRFLDPTALLVRAGDVSALGLSTFLKHLTSQETFLKQGLYLKHYYQQTMY